MFRAILQSAAVPVVHPSYVVYLVNKFNKVSSLCAINVWACELWQISLISLCVCCVYGVTGFILYSARVNLEEARCLQTPLLLMGVCHLCLMDLICLPLFLSLYCMSFLLLEAIVS